LDTAPAALLVVQDDGRVRAQNNSARQLLGTTPHDLKFLSERSAGRSPRIAPGTRQVVQLPDGRRLLVSAAQFSVPGGELQLLVSLQRITGELDAVELLAWQEMARVLTHEMMNSLTPIASLSESLEVLVRRAQPADSAQLDELAAALEVIKRRSLGLTNFVERYRKVVELPQPKLESIDAAAILAGIDQLMRARFKDLGIAYCSEVIPANLRFPADPQLLEQAIINLLSNASDAVAGSSQPQIELRCELHEQRILLTVRDNGIGLPPNGQEQIFVPFFTTKPHGSGIGLSLARQIAVAHGGTLDVQAVLPQGLLLMMSLPLQQLAVEDRP
jgi:C4-dicarboxylate-specific signal transduction histidine kinase